MDRSRRIVLKGVAAALAAAALPLPAHLNRAFGANKPVHHTVEISRFRFTPKVLAVRAGDTITWVNQDVVPHTATAVDESWDTGRLKKGEQAQIEVTGDFHTGYFCRYHPHMKASVELKE